ncbi:LIM domain-containing protein [Histoplasma capsulatum var. duboisii H88]|uniref:LIM domain-containing protein n=1 Tax=Ajellomyces capsulatus (strain H88) TaxID=544711 RepID=F0U564_AJEC8|nr:LIM domain-containing protein [Histoplasma capsulatum var. duboisii H88]QSS52319.1 LIM domain-containing protein [Histoplasma capsulatum var. duboisii H88]
MIHSRSKHGTRKVSPPGPSYMNEEQIATYLKDLRTNRPPRPNGSRPFPTKSISSSQRLRSDLPPRASSALSMNIDSENHRVCSLEPYQRSASALSHHRKNSTLSNGSVSTEQSLEEEPEQSYDLSRSLSPAASVRSTTGTYRIRGQRWMEREEARSLRQALEEMDFRDDEKRLHAAAQEEATQLVFSHQTSGFPKLNPHAPYLNPDLIATNQFRQHLKKGAYARSQSLNTSEERNQSVSQSRSHRSASDSSSNGGRTGRESPEFQRRVDPTGSNLSPKIVEVPEDNEAISVTKNGTLTQKPRVNFALETDNSNSPRTVVQRKASPRTRIASNDSAKGIFRNPEDQIYEEPQEDEAPNHVETTDTAPPSSALKVKPRNSLPRGTRPFPKKYPPDSKKSVFDIHKNPPSQARNPVYTENPSPSPTATSNPKGDDTPQTKDGKEIRGDDIRAATSMRLKDRSSKLPMPTVVSDRPGRPIVSFDPSWRIKSQSNSPRDSPRNSLVGSIKEPAVEVTPPPGSVVPAIKVSDDPPAPVINVCGDDSAALAVSSSGPPTIAEMKAAEEKPRPLPNPSASQNGKQNQRNSRGSSTNRWYTPYTRTGVPTASCSACGLPIAGRVVTACGSRFHPECFSCHHCHTPLECVAFYQEPEGKRAERLADAESNDEEANALRFYCHLDFHELFSPRCKSCKTPIEGEVVVACGAEWHVGHFFCAECGDPFTPTTPFVEHAGYAWCVRCHSKRTASRCQGCKQLVLDDLVVTALGGEWHEKCFVCSECSGSFGPEGRFFVREGKQRFTKNGRPIIGSTDTAVCEACEGRRLKA